MRTLGALFLLGVLALPAWAQNTTATVAGRVLDGQGVGVPAAAVKLLNRDTALALESASSPDGAFVFALLPPGPYRLVVEKSGFDRFAAEFKLDVDQTLRVDATLKVGQVSESITVSGQVAVVESETSSLGEVMSNREIVELPLNGRNPFMLAELTPGVQPLGSFGEGLQSTRAASQQAGANNFQANGGVAGSNEILLDGVPITVCCQGQPVLIPSVDVTSEFKVQTNASSSEFGRSSGGILNIISKAGTNRFRGSVYEFVRNEQFDAAGFNVNRTGKPPIPGRNDQRVPLRFNQYGFSFGGPVLVPRVYNGRNRTFLFGGLEATSVRKTSFVTSVVPPAEIRSGDFKSAPYAIYDPQTTRSDPARPGQSIRSPFPNAVVPSARINPIAVNYAKYYPLPIRSGIIQNYDWLSKPKDDDLQGNVRIDHNVNDANRFFGRFSASDDSHIENDYNPNGPNLIGQYVTANTFVFDYVRVLSSSKVIDIRYGMSRQRNNRRPNSIGSSPTELGFPAAFAAQQWVSGYPAVTVSGYRAISDDAYRNWSRYTHALASTFTWIRNAHTLKMGWDGRLMRDNELTLDGGAGSFTFDGAFLNGPDPRVSIPVGQQPYDSYAAFLLGYPSGGQIRYSDTVARQQWYHGFFLQDDWRATRKLTLNLGARLDVETGFKERYNRQSWFNTEAASPMAAATGLPIRGAVEFAGRDGNPRALWPTNVNLSPRFGLAYSITPKTVVRGAYGIMVLPTSQRGYGITTPGFQVTTTLVTSIDGVNVVGGLSNPYPNGVTPLTGASAGAMTAVGSAVSGFDYNSARSYAQQWNFGVQREVWHGTRVAVVYAGGHGVKLPMNFSANDLQLPYFGTPGDQTRVAQLQALVNNPFYGLIPTGNLAPARVQAQVLLRMFPQYTTATEQWRSWGDASYNSLQVSAAKSTSNGLNMRAAFTWSKNLGNVSNLTTGFLDVGSPAFQNDWARKIERSVAPTDVKYRFVASASYELPFGRGHWYGGWQTNGIFRAQSGFPLQFVATGVATFAGSRPSFVSAGADVYTEGGIRDRIGGISGGAGYLNRAAFRLPLNFELGDVPRLTDGIRAPFNWGMDTSVTKFFRLREGLRLQWRVEVFNPINHVIFATPNTTVGNPSFGIIGGQGNRPRNLQMGLKLLW